MQKASNDTEAFLYDAIQDMKSKYTCEIEAGKEPSCFIEAYYK